MSGPSVSAVIRLLDEDPGGWGTPANGCASMQHPAGFVIGWEPYAAVNGWGLGWFSCWRLNRALSRRRAWLVERYLAEKADSDLARLLSD